MTETHSDPRADRWPRPATPARAAGRVGSRPVVWFWAALLGAGVVGAVLLQSLGPPRAALPPTAAVPAPITPPATSSPAVVAAASPPGRSPLGPLPGPPPGSPSDASLAGPLAGPLGGPLSDFLPERMAQGLPLHLPLAPPHARPAPHKRLAAAPDPLRRTLSKLRREERLAHHSLPGPRRTPAYADTAAPDGGLAGDEPPYSPPYAPPYAPRWGQVSADPWSYGWRGGRVFAPPYGYSDGRY